MGISFGAGTDPAALMAAEKAAKEAPAKADAPEAAKVKASPAVPKRQSRAEIAAKVKGED
jgi:hypothetical protein